MCDAVNRDSGFEGRYMRRRILHLCIGALLANLVTDVSAVTISVDPAAQSIPRGTAANIALRISGLGDTTSISTFDIVVGFDPARLAFREARFGDPAVGDQLDLLGLGSITDRSIGSGSIRLFELSLDSVIDLDSQQADSFVLASIAFDAIATGASPITLTIDALGDSNGIAVPADLAPGAIEVTGAPVAEPGTGWLLVWSLPTILTMHRRRKLRRCDRSALVTHCMGGGNG